MILTFILLILQIRIFLNLNEYSNSEVVFQYSPSKTFHSPFGRLNQLQRWYDLQRMDYLARKISKVIDTKNYDLVYVQPCMWTQAPLVLRYLQTPTLYYCHELPRSIYKSGIFSRNRHNKLRSVLDYLDPLTFLYKSTLRNFDWIATRSAGTVLVNSKFIQKRVRQIYEIDPVISYHGVDTDIFRSSIKNADKPFVLSVGAIQPHKGYDFLIESFSYIDKMIRPSLYLIGNAANYGMQEYLQELARKYDVDLKIELRLSQAMLVQRYNKSLLVAYAPHNEPFGLVPLEAMSCSKPVVGIREGGVMETVKDKKTGFLIDRDPEKFGKAIQYLLENPLLAAQYGKNGREHVLEFWSWEKSVSNLEQYMYDLIH